MKKFQKKKSKASFIATILISALITGCSTATNSSNVEELPKEETENTTATNEMQEVVSDEINWELVLENGKNTEVNIFMWGGNDLVNNYMDGFVSSNLKAMYNITLNRVPMNAPDFVSKVLNEKKNNVEEGTIDILWINAENFKVLKDVGALYGPFADSLPNRSLYYDENLEALHYDSGIPVDETEALFGLAQLVYTYDSLDLENPPLSYAEILEYAKNNHGKFTYPNPVEDFVGSGFVRNAYFEFTDFDQTKDYTYEEFLELSKPVIDYFKELHPHLWNDGNAFPATVALQNNMFINGEVDITMGFEVYQTAGLVAKGEYPETTKTYVLETGTISNSHYLAIPYNSVNKDGALLVIDFLQSPIAQIEKMKPEVWGDLTGIDVNKLSEDEKNSINEIENNPSITTSKDLAEHRINDMNAKYIEWIEQIWTEEIIG